MNDPEAEAWAAPAFIRGIADLHLSADERATIGHSGWGHRVGFGSKVGLLVVDVTYAFCGSPEDDPEDLFNSCGPVAAGALEQIEGLLKAFRSAGSPIYFTRLFDRDEHSASRGRWLDKNPKIAKERVDLNRIVKSVAPGPGEPILLKDKPSAFFGTALQSYLTDAGVDTLVVCGTTTSGCVRATVVDAFSYNLRVIVPHDATFDRWNYSHESTLFDIDAKYADVMSAREIGDVIQARVQLQSGPSAECLS